MAHPETSYESMDEVYRVLCQLTIDRVPPEYERCYAIPITAVKTDISPKAPRPRRENKHGYQTRESRELSEERKKREATEEYSSKPEKESRGMRLYVMVLLYMLLFAGAAFLIYSVFFLQ